MPGKRLGPDVLARLRRGLVEEKMSVAQAAATYGLNKSTVRTYIRRALRTEIVAGDSQPEYVPTLDEIDWWKRQIRAARNAASRDVTGLVEHNLRCHVDRQGRGH